MMQFIGIKAWYDSQCITGCWHNSTLNSPILQLDPTRKLANLYIILQLDPQCQNPLQIKRPNWLRHVLNPLQSNIPQRKSGLSRPIQLCKLLDICRAKNRWCGLNGDVGGKFVGGGLKKRMEKKRGGRPHELCWSQRWHWRKGCATKLCWLNSFGVLPSSLIHYSIRLLWVNTVPSLQMGGERG